MTCFCYAPQTGCTEYEKDQFWETIDSEMQAVKRSERLMVAGYINGHVGSDMIGYEEVHGGTWSRSPKRRWHQGTRLRNSIPDDDT